MISVLLRCVLTSLLVASLILGTAFSSNAAEPTRTERIAAVVAALKPELVARRRDIHEHPELSNREERTAQLVADKLRELGLENIQTNIAKHGVIAVLKGGKPGPVVAIRADMDALPITEVHSVPYKSLNPGVMHACGHDAHTTIGLGVAEVLSQMRSEISGSVKFIFQPDEEGSPTGEPGGAMIMVKEGVLEHPRPSAIFALHVSPELEVGTLGYRAGASQASSENLDIIIHGKMGHAAHPDRGVDAIVVASQCVTALQTIKSRRVDPFDPVILTIGTMHGGSKRNIMTDEVRMEGTLRTFDTDVRKRVETIMRELLDGITKANEATYELKFVSITAEVYNNPRLVAGAMPAMNRVVGATSVLEVPQRMGAEDFSFYQEQIPGFLFRLGCGNKARGITSDIHTPGFDIDEDCLAVGVKTMANIVLDFLDVHSDIK